MEYLLGWSLLAGLILLLWLIVRFEGGERGEPRASCGLDGCASQASDAGGWPFPAPPAKPQG